MMNPPAVTASAAGRADRRLQRAAHRLAWLGAASIALSCGLACAQEAAAEFPDRLDGDIGVSAASTRSVVRGTADSVSPLPYANFDYGRAFVRIDTLGVKTVSAGYGHVELIARVSQDGFKADTPALTGIADRRTPVPVGLGSLQVTPLGAVFINGFHDVNRSNGNLAELIYAAQLDLGSVTLYPEIGIEYLSRQYARYFYGISQAESKASAYAAYQPGSALNPLLGLLGEIKLTPTWYLNFYLRRRWLDQTISASPLVARAQQDSGLLALSYRFK
jgi:outer membrane protein